MLKIMIVDDERIIRKGLSSIILELGGEYRLCGEAANGCEALGQIEIEPPDIVITDIKMPRMDGIEFIKRLQEMHPAIKKVVLSGFDDFEYVRESMKNGAVEYLLKPVDEIQLMILLKKIKEDLKDEKQKRLDAIDHRNKLSGSLPSMRDQFLKELICERKHLLNDSLDDKLAYFGIEFHSGVFFLIRIRIDNANWLIEQSGIEEFKIKLTTIRLIAEESIEQHFPFISFQSNTELVFICCVPAQYMESVRHTVSSEIYNNLTQYSKIPFSMGVGRMAAGIAQLSDSYRDVKKIMGMDIYSVGPAISYIENAEKTGVNNELPSDITRGYHRGLEDALEDMSKDRIRETIHDFSRRLYDIRPDLSQCVKAFSDGYMNLLIHNVQFYTAVQAVYGGSYSYIRALELFDTLDAISEYTIKIYSEIICQMEHLANTKDRRLVKQVRGFIEQRYHEDLTLNKVADDVSVNPNYLSVMFKSQTGESFVDYFTRIRIEKAKQLLKDIRLKTYEVGELVGYHDAAYFSKVFKKQVGVSPSEYRNLVK